MRYAFSLLLLAPLLSAQSTFSEPYRITRQGAYWTRIDTGVLPPSARVTVMSPGKVHAQGEWRGDIGYTIKRRVRARDLNAARKLLAGPPLFHHTQDGAAVISVVPGAGAVELDLRLPRGTRQMLLSAYDGAISAADIDGFVHARTHSGAITLDRIEGDVQVDTGAGELRLSQIYGSIQSFSGAGEIAVRDAYGPIRAISEGGSIFISRASSTVDARTKGGLVDIQRVSGFVDATTNAGAIQLAGLSRGVRASTSCGSIVAALQDLSATSSFLRTGAGDITVFLPSTLAVTVDADNRAAGAVGRIFSEFPELRFFSSSLAGAKALGALNGGGPVLRLSASGGLIQVKRKP